MQTLTFSIKPEPIMAQAPDGTIVKTPQMEITLQMFVEDVDAAKEAGELCANLTNAFMEGYADADAFSG